MAVVGTSMWYFDCLLLLVAGWAVCVPVGSLLARLAPDRTHAFCRAYFTPALGLGFFCVLADIHGWVAAFSQPSCGAITLLLGFTGWLLETNRWQLLRRVLFVSVVSFVASFPALAGIWHFEAFNPFTDAFTYLQHAQWMQTHSFRTIAIVDGAHPGLSQIALYQFLQERMGTSFALGWLQAVAGQAWSYRMFPVLNGLFLTAAAFGSAGVIHRIAGGGRSLALTGGLLAVLLPGGLRFGALYGFLPQTAGLTFLLPALYLFGVWVSRTDSGVSWESPRNYVGIAVLLAACGVCYFALLPFTVIALCGAAALATICRQGPPRSIGSWAFGAVGLAATVAAMMHVEVKRAVAGILFNIGAAVGGPVVWKLSDFVGHAFGLRAGSWEPVVWLPASKPLALSLILICGLTGFWLISRRTTTRRSLAAILVLIGVGIAAFAKFLYFTPRPAGWQWGRGSSWSAFKVVEWLSPFLFVIAAAGFVWILGRSRLPRWLCACLGAALLAAALVYNDRDAAISTRGFRQSVGVERSPFATLEALHDYALSHHAGRVLHLDFAPHEQKLRQMLIYFLGEFRLAGAWSTDGYLFPMLPEGQRDIFPDTPDAVRFSSDDPAQTEPLARFGRIIATRGDYVAIRESTADYGRESDASGWWYWVKNEIRFACDTPPANTKSLTLSAVVGLYKPANNVYAELLLPGRPTQRVQLKIDANGSAVSDRFNIPPQTSHFELRLKCDAIPERLSENDSRAVTFIVRNLRFRL